MIFTYQYTFAFPPITIQADEPYFHFWLVVIRPTGLCSYPAILGRTGLAPAYDVL